MEKTKTSIELFKTYSLALLSALFAMCAYLLINFKSLEIWQIIIIGLGIFFAFVGVFALLIAIALQLRKLKDTP